MTPEEDAEFLEWVRRPLAGQPYGPFGGAVRSGWKNYLGSTLGNLPAALGMDTQDFANRKHAEAAEIEARTTGAKTWGEVEGLTSFSEYARSLLGSSIPYMGEAVLAGVTGGVTGGAGLAARTVGARAVAELGAKLAAERAAGGVVSAEMTAKALKDAATSLTAGRGAMGGVFVGSIPSSAGDIAQNQYEEAGEYNLPSIAAGAPAYAALNLLGPAAMAIRGATGRRFLSEFLPEGLAGSQNRAVRAAAGLGAGVLMEGVGETGQEMINQAGRIAVNPDASMTSPDALHRYAESFMGGLTLGGITGGVGGAFTKTPMKTPDDMGARIDEMAKARDDIAAGRVFDAQRRDNIEAAGKEAQREAEKQLKAYEKQATVDKNLAKIDADEANAIYKAEADEIESVLKVETDGAKALAATVKAAMGIIDGEAYSDTEKKAAKELLAALAFLGEKDAANIAAGTPMADLDRVLDEWLKKHPTSHAYRAASAYAQASATVPGIKTVAPVLNTGTPEGILGGVPVAKTPFFSIPILDSADSFAAAKVRADTEAEKQRLNAALDAGSPMTPADLFNLRNPPTKDTQVLGRLALDLLSTATPNPSVEIVVPTVGNARRRSPGGMLKKEAQAEAARPPLLAPYDAPKPEGMTLEEARGVYAHANELLERALDSNLDDVVKEKIIGKIVKNASDLLKGYTSEQLQTPHVTPMYRSSQLDLELTNANAPPAPVDTVTADLSKLSADLKADAAAAAPAKQAKASKKTPFRSAAFRHDFTGEVRETGPIHLSDRLPKEDAAGLWIPGFVTHEGVFHNRDSAAGVLKGAGSNLHSTEAIPKTAPAPAQPTQTENTPVRYDPSVDRYNGEKLARGTVLHGADGTRYKLDRAGGFMLTVDRLNDKDQPAGIESFSVDPFDTDRYRDVYREPKTQEKPNDNVTSNDTAAGETSPAQDDASTAAAPTMVAPEENDAIEEYNALVEAYGILSKDDDSSVEVLTAYIEMTKAYLRIKGLSRGDRAKARKDLRQYEEELENAVQKPSAARVDEEESAGDGGTLGRRDEGGAAGEGGTAAENEAVEARAAETTEADAGDEGHADNVAELQSIYDDALDALEKEGPGTLHYANLRQIAAEANLALVLAEHEEGSAKARIAHEMITRSEKAIDAARAVADAKFHDELIEATNEDRADDAEKARAEEIAKLVDESGTADAPPSDRTTVADRLASTVANVDAATDTVDGVVPTGAAGQTEMDDTARQDEAEFRKDVEQDLRTRLAAFTRSLELDERNIITQELAQTNRMASWEEIRPRAFDRFLAHRDWVVSRGRSSRMENNAALRAIWDSGSGVNQEEINRLYSANELMENEINHHLLPHEKVVAAREIRARSPQLGKEGGWNGTVSKEFLSLFAQFRNNLTKFEGKLLEIFKKLAKQIVAGVLAFTIAFSPTLTTDRGSLAFAMPSRAEVIETISAAGEARVETKTQVRYSVDFQGVEAGSQVRYVASRIVSTGDNNNLPFIVVDKNNGFLFAFDAKGTLYVGGKAPVITGASGLDTLTARQKELSISQMSKADKVTPAGRFEAHTDYVGDVIVDQHGSTVVAIHRNDLSNTAERRDVRINSKNPLDKWVSYGCLNVPGYFMDTVITGNFTGKSIVYVLPSQTSLRNVFNFIDDAYETAAAAEQDTPGTPANKRPATGRASSPARRQDRADDANEEDVPDNQAAPIGDTRAWVKKLLTSNTNPKQLLTRLRDSRHVLPAHRKLAEILLTIGVSDVTLVYKDEPGEGKNGEPISGSFTPNKNKVTIYRGGENPRTVLHEFFHSNTSFMVNRAEGIIERQKNVTNKTLGADDRALLDAYYRVKDLMAEAEAQGGKKDFPNAFKSMREFLTDAMSQPEFTKFLAETDSKAGSVQPSLLQRIMRAFYNFIKAMPGVNTIMFDSSVLAHIVHDLPTFFGGPQDGRVGRFMPTEYQRGPLVKGKGGYWHPDSASHYANGLINGIGLDSDTVEAWAKRAVTNYLNKYAGQVDDPLKDVRIPGGKWGDFMEKGISSWTADTSFYAGEVGRGTEPVWAPKRIAFRDAEQAPYYRRGIVNDTPTPDELEAISDYPEATGVVVAIEEYLYHVGNHLFDAITDVGAVVNMEKLNRYDLVRAVKETAAADIVAAAKALKERGAIEAKRKADTENMTVYRKYPEVDLPERTISYSDRKGGTVDTTIPPETVSFSWVKLDKPGQLNEESTYMSHSVKGYEPSAGHPDWTKASGNGGNQRYGLGGWEGIKTGMVTILSLRDSEGRSYATVEILRPGTSKKEIKQIKGISNEKIDDVAEPYLRDLFDGEDWSAVNEHDLSANTPFMGSIEARTYLGGLGMNPAFGKGVVDTTIARAKAMTAVRESAQKYWTMADVHGVARDHGLIFGDGNFVYEPLLGEGEADYQSITPIGGTSVQAMIGHPGEEEFGHRVARAARVESKKTNWASEAWIQTSEGVSKALSMFNTNRFLAMTSKGIHAIVALFSAYNAQKLTLQKELDATLKPFEQLSKASQIRVSDHLVYFSTKFLREHDKKLPARAFYAGLHDEDIIIADEGNGTARANAELSAMGIPTRAQTEEAEGINAPLPKLTDAEYAGLVAALMASQQAAASQYYSAALGQTEKMNSLAHGKRLGMTDVANDKMNELRKAVATVAARMLQDRLVDDELGPITSAGATKLKDLWINVHALFNTNKEGAVVASQAQFEAVAESLNNPNDPKAFVFTADYIKEASRTILAGMKTSRQSQVEAVREYIMGGAEDTTALLTEKYNAIKSIITAYVPHTRSGRYIVQVYLEDENGDRIKEEDIPPALLRTIPIDSDDSLAGMELYREVLVKEFDGIETKGVKINSISTDVTWRVTEVTEKDIAAKTSTRVRYGEIMRALTNLGVKHDPEVSAQLMKATTNADAAVRKHLSRVGRPGVDENMLVGIATHLSKLASMIASRRQFPKLEAVIADRFNDYWGDGTKEIAAAQAAYDAVKDGTNESQKRIRQQQLAATKMQYRAQDRKHHATTRNKGAEMVTWFTGDGAEDSPFAAGLRSVVTVINLGWSFASAVTNLASLPVAALPGLATYDPKTGFGGGFGAVASAAALTKAFSAMMPVFRENMAQFFTNPTKSNPVFAHEWLAKQVKRARAAGGSYGGYSEAAWEFMRVQSETGATAPQNTNAMMGAASSRVYGSTTENVMGHMMSMFAATEELNRLTTLLASYELFAARATAAELDTSPDVTTKSEYDQYVQGSALAMVDHTQGNYSQSDRPKLFRSGPMSVIFMYKTFVVTMLELLHNLPLKGKLMMLGMLYMFSGLQGIPLFEELMTALDIVVQRTGLGKGMTKGNAERELNKAFKEWGEQMGVPKLDHVMMHGILDTMIGTKVFGRAGINVGIPLMGMFRAGADVEKELGKALGPVSGVVGGIVRGGEALLHGNIERAIKENPVAGLRNIGDAYLYAKYDNVLNKRGQIVIKDATVVDTMARALGFYPMEFALVNDKVRLEEYTRAYAKELTGDLIEDYRRFKVRGDTQGMQDVREAVREHNREFRGTALEILDWSAKAERAGKAAMKTLSEREKESETRAQRREYELTS